jgi:hypothetical protein
LWWGLNTITLRQCHKLLADLEQVHAVSKLQMTMNVGRWKQSFTLIGRRKHLLHDVNQHPHPTLSKPIISPTTIATTSRPLHVNLQWIGLALSVLDFLKSNQQSQYSVFHELMCWQSLTFRLSNVMSPLQRGDLLYHISGRMRGLKPKFY